MGDEINYYSIQVSVGPEQFYWSRTVLGWVLGGSIVWAWVKILMCIYGLKAIYVYWLNGLTIGLQLILLLKLLLVLRYEMLIFILFSFTISIPNYGFIS